MSGDDQIRWDRRYRVSGMAPLDQFGPPQVLEEHEHLIPEQGLALELACGRGRGAAWLAARGLDYFGVDVSPVAIDFARRLVDSTGLGERCRFAVHDLDDGLPEGPKVDLIFCHLFRDSRLDDALVERLEPDGILAMAVLSEVGEGPGRFRAKAGELVDAFGSLDILEAGEAEGVAGLGGRKSARARL